MQDTACSSKIDSSNSSVDNINIKKICRVCLSQFDLGSPLFEPSEMLNNTTAASLIWNCFGIKIPKNEKFPNQICNECSLNILISHNFKIQLQQSHKLLQTRYIKEEYADISEEGFHVIKLDDNLYRVKLKNYLEKNEHQSNQMTSNYDAILQSLRINNKLNLESDDILLIVADEPNNVKTTSKSKKIQEQLDLDIPKNFSDACKWLKIARHMGAPYECKICNRKYQFRYRTFYMHVRLHFMKKVQCSLCPAKYFPYRKKYHIRTHTKEKPHICSTCGKSFSMQNHLNRHLKFNCDIKKESACKICKEIFTTYKLLHMHMLKDHGTCRHEYNKNECKLCKKENENKQMCEYCGTKVTRYNRHLNTCKAAPINIKFQLQNATTCEKCGELLFSNYQIQCHMKTHENSTKFSCKVCGKMFLRKQYLKDHMEIHEPGHYSCEKCDKIFKRRLLLKRHRRTHETTRKHTCPVCCKGYKTKDYLNKHLLVHSETKPHVCSICNKSFRLKSNLKQHLALHTKVKPFSCSICSKTFALKGNLTKHVLIHNKPKI